jgi:2-phosphosulfolactate phosphatase
MRQECCGRSARLTNTFVIDYLPECARQYRQGCAVVAIDVIRATTMAVTAAALGRECYPAGSLEAAFHLAARLKDPLLAGELKGDMPAGFEMNNSPAALSDRNDMHRPLVMVSSSGTRLISNAKGSDAVYLGCFRNARSLAGHLGQSNHNRIALIGAGSRGEFREEDQIACAWIAAELLRFGYMPENKITEQIVDTWANAAPEACLVSNSVEYLRRTGQMVDLYFILDHINDLEDVFVIEKQKVVTTRERDISRQTDALAVY